MSSPSPTLQSIIHTLGQDPASLRDGRGLRFCHGREAPTHEGIELSWRQVAARVRWIAARLAEAGVGGGDVVVVHCHDQQAAMLAMLGSMHLGALPTAVAPIGSGAPERLVEQFHGIMRVAHPRLLVLDRPIPADQLSGRPALPPQLTLDGFEEAAEAPVLRHAGPDDACFLQFTSGSTSLPKGVVVTQRMIVANVEAIAAAVGYTHLGRVLGWLPIYHDMSLVGTYLMSVRFQARGCFFPTSRFGRSPDLWMRLMSEDRAQSTAGPNFAFAMVNRHAERRPPSGIDLSGVRAIICGSEPISAAIMRRFHEVHAPVGLGTRIMPAFGMAESTLMATACREGAPLATLTVAREALEQRGLVEPAAATASGDGGGDAGTQPAAAVELVGCGAAARGMHVAIAGEGGGLAADGRVGEVLLRGDSVLSAYFEDPAATAAAFTVIAGERWFRTGDRGFLALAAGTRHLFICGRAKDIIIHNGVNYYPADVEHALADAPGERVRLAAVVDLRVDLSAEFIGLGVLFEEGSRAGDAAANEAWAAEFVRSFTGLPVAVALALRGDHIPRTTSGKLVRPAIRDRLRTELARRALAAG